MKKTPKVPKTPRAPRDWVRRSQRSCGTSRGAHSHDGKKPNCWKWATIASALLLVGVVVAGIMYLNKRIPTIELQQGERVYLARGNEDSVQKAAAFVQEEGNPEEALKGRTYWLFGERTGLKWSPDENDIVQTGEADILCLPKRAPIILEVKNGEYSLFLVGGHEGKIFMVVRGN